MVARVQNHSFRLYWTRPRSPNNTQTFGKDTSERYCELFLVSDFSPLLFPTTPIPVQSTRYSNNIRTKPSGHPIRNEGTRVQQPYTHLPYRSFVSTRSPEWWSHLLRKSYFFHSLFHSFTPLYLSNKPHNPIFEDLHKHIVHSDLLVSSDPNSQFFFVSYSSYSFPISFKDIRIGSRNILSCAKVVRSGVKWKKWKNNRIFDKRSCKDRSEKMIPLRTLKIQFGPLMSVEGTSSHSKRMCGGEKSFLGRWNSGG